MVDSIVCGKVTTKQLIILAVRMIYLVSDIQYVDVDQREQKLTLAIQLANKWIETLIDCYLPTDGSK